MSETNGQHDAHVQVLTAEVRTLMVGSRQVTLSVYNQLDSVRYTDIEPFGRVNPRQAEQDWYYVVGRERDDGTLVRSRLPTLAYMVRMSRERKEIAHGRLITGDGRSTLERRLENAFGVFDEDEITRVTGKWQWLPLIVLAGLR